MPHIPLHFLVVELNVECRVHRNRKVPVFVNVNDVWAPWEIDVDFDQFDPIDVTLWGPSTDLQTTFVPVATETARGFHL